MSTPKKIFPELELPERLAALLSEYLGARRLGQLSQDQRRGLMTAAGDFSSKVGEIVAAPVGAPGRSPRRKATAPTAE